jgi:hypothetical protein
MRILLIGTWLLLLAGTPARANGGFSCGGADFDFSFAKRSEAGVEAHVEAIISVSRSERGTVLRYDGGVDVVGGVCVHDGRGKPTIVFQAYCSGSGCHDLDNWGIIDPEELLVRLVPNDWNRRDAEKILGRPLPKINHPIYISDEAKKLGLKW